MAGDWGIAERRLRYNESSGLGRYSSKRLYRLAVCLTEGHWKDAGIFQQASYKGERLRTVLLHLFQMFIINGVDNLITATATLFYGIYHNGLPIVSNRGTILHDGILAVRGGGYSQTARLMLPSETGTFSYIIT